MKFFLLFAFCFFPVLDASTPEIDKATLSDYEVELDKMMSDLKRDALQKAAAARNSTTEIVSRLDELNALSKGAHEENPSMTQIVLLLHKLQSMMSEMQANKKAMLTGLAANSLAQQEVTIQKLKESVSRQVEVEEKTIEARVAQKVEEMFKTRVKAYTNSLKQEVYGMVDHMLQKRQDEILSRVSTGIGLGNFAAGGPTEVDSGPFDGVVSFDTKETVHTPKVGEAYIILKLQLQGVDRVNFSVLKTKLVDGLKEFLVADGARSISNVEVINIQGGLWGSGGGLVASAFLQEKSQLDLHLQQREREKMSSRFRRTKKRSVTDLSGSSVGVHVTFRITVGEKEATAIANQVKNAVLSTKLLASWRAAGLDSPRVYLLGTSLHFNAVNNRKPKTDAVPGENMKPGKKAAMRFQELRKIKKNSFEKDAMQRQEEIKMQLSHALGAMPTLGSQEVLESNLKRNEDSESEVQEMQKDAKSTAKSEIKRVQDHLEQFRLKSNRTSLIETNPQKDTNKAHISVRSFSYDADSQNGPSHWSESWKKCSGESQSPISIADLRLLKFTDLVETGNIPSILAVETPDEADQSPAMRQLRSDIIEDRAAEVLDSDSLPLIRIMYPPVSGLRLVNNGHSILVQYPFSKNGTLSYGSQTFKLRQFSLHTPGEHAVNGKKASIELHLIHEKENMSSTPEFLVLAIRFMEGASSPFLAGFIDAIPDPPPLAEKGTREGPPAPPNSVSLSDDAQLDLTVAIMGRTPAQLLPQQYYEYKGSLTTPPCIENVTWLLPKWSKTASEKQIKLLQQSLRDGMNARPLQNANWKNSPSVLTGKVSQSNSLNDVDEMQEMTELQE